MKFHPRISNPLPGCNSDLAQYSTTRALHPSAQPNPRKRRFVRIRLGLAAMTFGTMANAFAWAPAPGHMMTKYAATVNPTSAWVEYPRPQLVPPKWTNLNGLWNYAITTSQPAPPAHWDRQILVPFGLESSLGGVCRPLRPDQVLWYERKFEFSRPSTGDRALLHFEAVNYLTEVVVNGKNIGHHQGGYDPFTLDMTDALAASKTQDLVVKVVNPTGEGNYPYQPRGKVTLGCAKWRLEKIPAAPSGSL
jgi:hypothetical protein